MSNITMKDVEEAVKNCKKCMLYETRTNYVLGDGNLNSDIMIIGEAPGQQEDLQGRAFVGKSGKLLDKMLEAIHLDRNQVYICNILKCRPPHNRNPLQQEQNACMDYLRYQFLIMQPKYVLLLGSVACKAILEPSFSIMKNHGKIVERKGVVFVPTFHPSALLRDASKKQLAWEDLKVLRAKIDEK